MFQITAPLSVIAGALCLLSACAEAPGQTAPQTSEHSASEQSATAQNGAATAILNAGVMANVGAESVKLLFDPLYDNHFGSLAELPPELAEAIITGAAPYDDVDLVFVSHAHGDHFSASMLVEMLLNDSDLWLIAPGQAYDQLKEQENWHHGLATQVRTITLRNGEATQTFDLAGATIKAFRSPHSGWPERHSETHNISYRVSVSSGDGEVMRVMHLGDADPATQHFAPFADFLSAKRTGLVMVPFWFYQSDDLDAILEETLNADTSVAVHVPVNVPAYLSEGTRPYFTQVGEVVEIPITAQ